jgi:hypothetical protein
MFYCAAFCMFTQVKDRRGSYIVMLLKACGKVFLTPQDYWRPLFAVHHMRNSSNCITIVPFFYIRESVARDDVLVVEPVAM